MQDTVVLPQSQLTTFFDRLEAATSRLEDMATSIDSEHPATINAITSGATNGSQASPSISPEQKAPTPEPVPRFIEDFDKIVSEDVSVFVAASEKLDDLLAEQVHTSSDISNAHADNAFLNRHDRSLRHFRVYARIYL